jgi:uncharacterized phiE125 gp8 family phage protein
MKIITPPTVEPITLVQARKQCKVDAEGDPPVHEDDDLLMLYATAAREWCEHFTGIAIAPTGVQIEMSSFPSAIVLESGPVIGITSVTYLDDAAVRQTVAPSVYYLDTNGSVTTLRLKRGQAWPVALAETGSVRVQYDIGFGVVTTPPPGNTSSDNGYVLAGYVYDGYIVSSGGSSVTSSTSDNGYVLAGYVLDGYIASESSPSVGTTVPKAISVAMLLILAHLYKNREDTAEKAMLHVPMGARALLTQHRVRRGWA